MPIRNIDTTSTFSPAGDSGGFGQGGSKSYQSSSVLRLDATSDLDQYVSAYGLVYISGGTQFNFISPRTNQLLKVTNQTGVEVTLNPSTSSEIALPSDSVMDIIWDGAEWRGEEETPLTPAELTLAYPYKQIWFPAHVLTPGGVSGPTMQDVQINAQNKTFKVASFSPTADQSCYATLAFEKFELDTSDPTFRVVPVFFQSAVASPSPMQVRLTVGIQNTGPEDSLDVSFTTTDTNNWIPTQQWKLDIYEVFNEVALDVGSTPLSAGGLNFLQIQFSRLGSNGSDTFTGEIHLLGLRVQYKTNFANIAEWPDPSPT